MNKTIQKQKGFTLSEMMIVITIIAIVTIISIRIQKSRSNYETKFMTYSAYMNLKHAIGEVVADGWKDAGGTSQVGVPDIWNSTTSPHFGFCQRLGVPDVTSCNNCGVFNTTAAANCGLGTSADGTVSGATPDFITTNGQRYFHGTTTTPYTIYIDINGTKGSGTLNSDILKFYVTASGIVYPDQTSAAATNPNYLSAAIRYRDSSGNQVVVSQGVSLLSATCDATGTYFGNACTPSSNYTTYCKTSTTGNTCEVIIERPGF